MNIFQLDWILIDTVIILLLVFLLIGVRLFKQFSRWRLSPSNIKLRVQNIPVDEVTKSLALNRIKFESCKMISTPNKKKEPKKPIILFFNSNFNLELLNVLSEGLVCSGYIALQLDLRINWNLKTLIKTKTADNPVHGEIYSCVSALLDFLTQTNLLKHPHYLIVKFGKSDLPYEALMNDPNNKGIILLNPKRRAIFRNLSSFHSLTERKKVLLLFSYIPYLLFKYRFSLTQLKTAANELLVLKNALYSFKHHETILLGLILKFINHGTKNT